MDSSDGGPSRLNPIEADAAARALTAGPLFALRFLAVVAAYYLTARLGLLIPYVGTHISLVWLPTGIAVAAFRRWGAGMTLPVYIGAVAANAAIGGPLWIALLVGMGNTAGTGLAAWLLHSWDFEDRLLRRRDVSSFLAAVVLGMLVTSLNGVTWLRVAGAPDAAHFGQAWLGWMVGDTVGALLAGVPLIAWSRRGAAAAFRGREGAVNVLLQAIVLACGVTIFSAGQDKGSAFIFPLLALPSFVLALLAMRGGVIASSTGVLLLSLAAAYGTARGWGPFAVHDAQAGSLALWSYITAQCCTSLLICRMGMALQASKRQFAAFLQHSPDGLLVIDEQGRLTGTNAAFATMLGLDARPLVGRRASEALSGAGSVVAALIAADAPSSTTELALPQADGDVRHVECLVARYRKASGHWQTHVRLRDITQAKLAQARLATSEARLKAVSDHMPALFAYVDRSQTYRFANAHFRHVMGIEPEALVGRSMRDFLGEAAHAALLPHIEGALRGEPQKFERTGWKENEAAHFMAQYVPDVCADGSVDGFFIMVLDITERHCAELALTRSEALVRAITDHVPGLISRMDRNYRYTFVNANYVSWFALPTSPVGKTVAEVFGEAVFASVRRRIDEALAGNDVVFDLTNTVPGAAEYMRVHYVPDRNEHGEVVGAYGLVTDRTEQQRAGERIEASERQLRTVTDNLPSLIAYVDAQEKLRFMNATFHDWLGVDIAAAIGRPLAEVVGAENYAPRQEYLRSALAGRRVEFELVSQTRAGPRNLQTVYLPDVRDDGFVRGIFTLSTDVTALKDVERELQRLARIDTLTGLANRRQFDELLEQALARHRRTQRPLALIFLDVDRFKAINDTHGHGAGDAVLKEFAARMHASLRETDVAARLAGDEFVVILDGLGTRDEAVVVATKLQQAIRAPMSVGEQALVVTASMGLAYLDGSVDIDAKALMVRADRALYRAKDGGRDALVVGDDIDPSLDISRVRPRNGS
ncbi:MAG: PAS domain-containing protein [Betaproteobacteria bacterium]